MTSRIYNVYSNFKTCDSLVILFLFLHMYQKHPRFQVYTRLAVTSELIHTSWLSLWCPWHFTMSTYSVPHLWLYLCQPTLTLYSLVPSRTYLMPTCAIPHLPYAHMCHATLTLCPHVPSYLPYAHMCYPILTLWLTLCPHVTFHTYLMPTCTIPHLPYAHMWHPKLTLCPLVPSQTYLMRTCIIPHLPYAHLCHPTLTLCPLVPCHLPYAHMCHPTLTVCPHVISHTYLMPTCVIPHLPYAHMCDYTCLPSFTLCPHVPSGTYLIPTCAFPHNIG